MYTRFNGVSTLGNPTFEVDYWACQTRCANTQQCQAWEYSLSTSQCKLAAQLNEAKLSGHRNYMVGPKQCG